jgi:hypothetical protein
MLRVLLLAISLSLVLSRTAQAGDEAAKPAPTVAKPAPTVAKPAPTVAKPAPTVAKPARPAKPDKAKPAKEPVTCQAQDDKGAVLATATAATSSLCRKQVYDALVKATCDGTKNSLKYMFVYKQGAAPRKAFLFCPKPKLVVPPAPGPCAPDKPGCPPPAPAPAPAK